MEQIVYRSVYDLVSQELGRSPQEAQRLAATDGDRLLHELERTGLPATGVVLAAPVPSPDGHHALLSSGTDLSCRLASLLRRQMKNPGRPIGPITLEPTAELLRHYRDKVEGRFAGLVEEVQRPTNLMWRRVVLGLPSTGQYLVQDGMKKALAHLLGSEKGLTAMLRATSGAANRGIWNHSLNTSIVAMAMSLSQKVVGRKRPYSDVSLRLQVAGAAGMLQDVGLMLPDDGTPDAGASHPLLSADFAAALGFDDEVVGAVRDHHRTRDQDGVPILNSKTESLGALSRLVVAANLFVGEVGRARGRGRDVEVVKAMHHMVAQGHLDRGAVNSLTRLYFSRKAAFFLEKANEIVALCLHRDTADPILWSVLGGQSPHKFICDHQSCMWLGTQTTVIARRIPLEFQGEVIATIDKGDYQNCRFLNKALGKLVKDVAAVKVH